MSNKLKQIVMYSEQFYSSELSNEPNSFFIIDALADKVRHLQYQLNESRQANTFNLDKVRQLERQLKEAKK